MTSMMRCRLARVRRGVAAGVLAAGTVAAAIVVASTPAGATPVSTEAELRAAFAADASVELLNDITLTDCTGGGAVERTTTDAVVLDGQGFTLHQTCPDNVIVQETIGAELFTVQNITISGGSSTGSGGGVFAQGDLGVIGSVFRQNHADQFGGAMATVGALRIESSLIENNNASQGGGGIAGDLVIDIENSTISGNLGGGVTTVPSTDAVVTVTNSTVTGNSAADTGAGITSGGSTVLVYATVTNNTADTAFGNIFSQEMASFGSVVTGGTDGGGPSNCLDSPQNVSNGYNFSDDDTCGFTQPTDRQNAGSPGLGALGDNGGPTPTQLPEAGSPLLDFIPAEACQSDGAAGITTDQRGVTRPQGDSCDIGAVEVEFVAPEPIPVVPTFTG